MQSHSIIFTPKHIEYPDCAVLVAPSTSASRPARACSKNANGDRPSRAEGCHWWLVGNPLIDERFTPKQTARLDTVGRVLFVVGKHPVIIRDGQALILYDLLSQTVAALHQIRYAALGADHTQQRNLIETTRGNGGSMAFGSLPQCVLHNDGFGFDPHGD